MEKHSVEDRALGMPRRIDSGHNGRMASRNGPSSRSWPGDPEKTGKAPVRQAKPGRESVKMKPQVKAKYKSSEVHFFLEEINASFSKPFRSHTIPRTNG